MSVIGTGAASSKKQQIRLSKVLAAPNISQLDEEDLGMLIEKANIENQAKITNASAASASDVEMPPTPSSNLAVVNPLQTA